MSTLDQIKALNQQLHEIQVEVLEGGKLPTKAHSDDAAYDLYATSDIIIYPGQVVKHPLNIRMKLPAATYASIESKSGLGAKGLLVYAGVIDAGYRGIVHAIITNLRTRDDEGVPLDIVKAKITIKKGEKLAQFITYPFTTLYYVTQVDSVDTNTSRGETGFGQSGV